MPKARRHSRTQDSEPVRPTDWLVVGLALLGLAVAGYLTVLKLGGQQAIFCRDGDGCDIVQSSRYALLAGVPTALWGAGLYAAILVLGLVRHTGRRWLVMFLLASGAVAFSAYLTYLSIAVIGSTCVYCLASGIIAILLLGALVARRPLTGPRAPRSLARLAGLGSMAGAVTVLAGAFMFAWEGSAPAGYSAALAEHLTQSRAIFYGADWCPACREQKARFGSAARLLPYVECNPSGDRRTLDTRCVAADVRSFPTWVIAGQKYEGVMSLERLADLSAFRFASPAAQR